MQWSVKASTLSGGNWLFAFPSSGVSDASSPIVPAVRVDVDPGTLTAGVYSGTIQISAPQADNNPQFVSVFLNVLPPGTNLGPAVQPSALIFRAITGTESPGSQTVTNQSLSSTPLTFTTSCVTTDGKNWCQVLPAGGTVTQSQPVRIVVQPQTLGLAANVYRATLTISFSDGSSRTVSLVFVVLPAGSTLPSVERGAGGCNPSKLAPVFSLLPSGFKAAVGFPAAIAVKVVDDCGNFQTTGSVNVSFDDGDSPLSLTSLKEGTWTTTWTPVNSANTVTLTANAEIADQNLKGSVQTQLGFLSLTTPPVIGAVLNGASFALNGPVAPGSYVSVFGAKLAVGQGQLTGFPLPQTLAGSSIVVGGNGAPLAFAREDQVNAQIPYETAVNTSAQVLVTRGSSFSAPQAITVAPAAPGVFTATGNGTGQGLIFVADSSGAQTLADATHPAKAGDALVIYCTGLGAVNPPVATGAAAPFSPLASTTLPATVTIGGVQQNIFFKGLTPGFAGLYQVNVIVQPGTPAGTQTLVITMAGQSSPPVTMSLK
jgi:adhesin/invasin